MSTHEKSWYTYDQAKRTISALGISNRPQYRARLKEDPRLHSNPDKYYSKNGWISWTDYFGRVKPSLYASYQEARLATQALSIKSQPSYRRQHREDPKLPSHPEHKYAGAGWTTWYDFLAKPTSSLYATYNQARNATLNLKIKTQKQYYAFHHQDPLLPSNPHVTYAKSGWKDWHSFLGNIKKVHYTTYQEARDAVRTLCISSHTEYIDRYTEDPKLPRTPESIYQGAGWVNWRVFLGKKILPCYGSYKKARAAVRGLKIKTILEYNVRYKEDPKLPSDPPVQYRDRGWNSWIQFLGKPNQEIYSSYEEAKLAVTKLNIKTSPEYEIRRFEDPRLPGHPGYRYKGSGWTNWYHFLGNTKRDIYPTLKEAQLAAVSLGIKSSDDYRFKYRSDERLPACPNVYYAKAGWIGWACFLKNSEPQIYPTLNEAKEAAKRLDIKTSEQYKVDYKADPRLPASPHKTYAQSGWVDWYEFLGKNKPIDLSAEYKNLSRDIAEWLKNETNLAPKHRALKSFLARYMKPEGCPDDARHLLLRQNPINTEAYRLFIDSLANSAKRGAHTAIVSFFSWALNKYCTDADPISEERTVLPDCRNPFENVYFGYSELHDGHRPSQSTKPPLGYEYILRARNFLVPNGEQAAILRPSLADLPHLQDFFNSSRLDWLEIDEALIDESDQNCITRSFRRHCRDDSEGNKWKYIHITKVWSPVRFVALYCLLRFPLRGQQILWLDSGEADAEIIAIDVNGNISWERNTGSLVGKGSKRTQPQAMAQRGHHDVPKLYVTTNKTGRTDGGYEIEWIPDDLLYWLVLLRDWQAKYNPIEQPTPWLSVRMPARTNEQLLKARGTQTFLFRIDRTGQPLSTASAYGEALPRLLYHIQREGENLAEARLGIGTTYTSPYTPHCLRVSLITAYIVDGDAPLHLVSKLVGHSSLVMTIYYIKLNSDQIRRFMGEAEKRAEKMMQQHVSERIQAQGLQALRTQLIATDGNRPLIESNVPNSACIVFDYGICPMSAACCHIGGESVEGVGEKIYGPVEAGYLGQKNCIRCRFFVTGVAFLGALVALANELSLEIHTESRRFQSFTSKVDTLEKEYYDNCLAQKPDCSAAKRKSASANMQQSGSKLDNFLNDYAALNHYIQGCLKLIRNQSLASESKESIRLISTGNLSDIGAAFYESRSQYHLLAEICQNAIIYQSSNPSRALPLIAQAIDRMAENNNMKPAMFRLTSEQKLTVANQLNNLLMMRLNSWERIDDLFSGDLTLLDLESHDPEISQISTEVQKLLSEAPTNRIDIMEGTP